MAEHKNISNIGTCMLCCLPTSPHVLSTLLLLGLSIRLNVRSMVLLEPPAPAARVLVGLALAILSFWSAAARLRMAVRGPPGGVGDEGRTTEEPLEAASA